MVKKAYILILTLLFTLSPIICRPFHIFGESSLFTEPFSGYNINIIDYAIDSDRIYTLSSNSSNGTFQTTSGSAISMGEGTMSNGKTYYSTGLAGGGVSLQGNITLNMSNTLSSSVTNTIRRIIEIEIILDNYYCGNASITLKNGSTILKEEIVQFNGTSSRFTYIDTSTNMTNADNYTIQVGSFYLVESVNRQYNFPIESFSYINNMFSFGWNSVGFDTYNTYNFPIFEISNNGQYVARGNFANNRPAIFVFYINRNIGNITQFNNYFSTPLTCTNIEVISATYGGRLVKATLVNQTGATVGMDMTYINSTSAKFIPIFIDYVADSYNVSTDFALTFGIQNHFLNNINIIANGNTSSNNSSSALNDSTEELTSTIDSYDTLENNAVNNMDSALNNIDMTNTPSAMGSKFQASAIWVKQQFDRMTNNTPFGSLLGFSLILGISLLIIGRVLR